MRLLSDPLYVCLFGNALLLTLLGGAFASFAPPDQMGPIFVQTVIANSTPLVAILAWVVVAGIGIWAVDSVKGKRSFAYAMNIGVGLLIVAVLVPPMVKLALA